jgi:predicted nucleic acid-binding protein
VILVDTGPLVAVIRPDDQYHEICTAALALLREPLFTVWPAVTEAMYFLNYSFEAQDALWEILERGTVRITELDSDDRIRMRFLMRKYRDLPMDFADAALVAFAERERINRIFTTDRRGFSVYKPAGMKRFEIVP